MQGNSATPEYFESLRVMVVDDQEYMRSLLSSILRGLQIDHVEVHGDAVEAYAALTRFDPTLILTDWEMKPVDGLRFVHRIRMGDDSPNRYVPIVMVTGHNHVDKVRQARDAGANDFLIKPVSAKSVYSRICCTIERPRPFVRATAYFVSLTHDLTGLGSTGVDRSLSHSKERGGDGSDDGAARGTDHEVRGCIWTVSGLPAELRGCGGFAGRVGEHVFSLPVSLRGRRRGGSVRPAAWPGLGAARAGR